MHSASREIRWFSRNENQNIIRWFASRGLTFEMAKYRTDQYLLLPGIDNLSIKLREGNIQVKKRIKVREKEHLCSKAKGYFETWEFWSFHTAQEDKQTMAIVQGEDQNWIPLEKQRMKILAVVDNQGKAEFQEASVKLNGGCAMEYTRLRIKGETWYTFAFEWFEGAIADTDVAFINEVLGNSVLKAEDSMGYPAYLALLFS